MKPSVVRIIAVVLFIVFFVIDLTTPVEFFASILFLIPIVLSSFAGPARFTWALVVAGLIANAVVGYVLGHASGFEAWRDVGGRGLVIAELLIVGILSTLLEGAMKQRTRLAEQYRRQAERETALRQAVEVVRSTIDAEQIDRVIVREAARALDADISVLFANLTDLAPTMYQLARGGDVSSISRRSSPQLSFLKARTSSNGEPVLLNHAELAGTSILDGWKVDSAVAAQLLDRGRVYGVLMVARTRSSMPYDADSRRTMWSFTAQASLAVSQALLFRELTKQRRTSGE